MSIVKESIESVQEYEPFRINTCLFGQLDEDRRQFFSRKYTLERLGGTLLLIVALPLILVLWVLVKITSRGPGFYHQPRLGLEGKEFEVYKIRTMTFDPEHDGLGVWCQKNDSRITRIGQVLRKLHLDELPQLLNVARGEMVLIGPRPEQPSICEDLKVEIEGYFDRVAVKPGITGLAQINLPPDTSIADSRRKQALDLHYINEANLFLEIRILLATVFRMFGIKGDWAMKSMGLCRKSVLDDLGLYPKKQYYFDNAGLPSMNSSPQVRKHEDLCFERDSVLDLDCDSIDSPTASSIG